MDRVSGVGSSVHFSGRESEVRVQEKAEPELLSWERGEAGALESCPPSWGSEEQPKAAWPAFPLVHLHINPWRHFPLVLQSLGTAPSLGPTLPADRSCCVLWGNIIDSVTFSPYFKEVSLVPVRKQEGGSSKYVKFVPLMVGNHPSFVLLRLTVEAFFCTFG